MSTPATPLDILAIAAHRDDVEQTCGGTLLKMAQRGHRTGILDLTAGEMGTRGTAEDREREAAEAARILQIAWRDNLHLPDARLENTLANRLQVARVIREQRPRVVILPYWKGRHPDHYTCSRLGYEACFLAGLAKLDLETGQPLATGNWQLATAPSKGRGFSRAEKGTSKEAASAAEGQMPPPHRPFKIVYATLYYDIRPSFVVDVTEQLEARLQATLAYKSQFTDQDAGRGIFPAHDEIRARVESLARFYGMLAGVKYGEPFVQKEVGLVDDLTAIPVRSI